MTGAEFDGFGAGRPRRQRSAQAGPRRSPEHVRAFASAEATRGDEQPEVELIEFEVVGDQVGRGQGRLAVLKAGVGAGRVAGGRGVGVGERDLFQRDVQWEQVPVLELAFDVVGARVTAV